MDYTSINGTQAVPSSTPEKPKVEPVVTKTDIKVDKPSTGKRLYSLLFSATPSEVASDLKRTVIIPAIKKGILDAITLGAAMLINGRNNNGSWPINNYYGGYFGGSTLIDYNSISRSRVITPQTTANTQPGTGPLGIFSLDTIGFYDPGKAELVKSKLLQHLAIYKVVTVSDYYDFCGLDHDWQAKNWGWDNLNGLEVVTKGTRFVLTLPPIRPIREI
jgi:hypothetical protein